MKERIVSFVIKTISQKSKRQIHALHVNENKESVLYAYSYKLCKYIFCTFLLTLFLIVILFFFEGSRESLIPGKIQRADPNQEVRTVEMEVRTKKETKSVQIQIPPREYSQKEIDTAFTEAKEYVQSHFLGRNEDTEHITTSLHLVQEIPDSFVTVSWTQNQDGVILENGDINENLVTEDVQTEMIYELSYGEEILQQPIQLTIKAQKKEKSWWEQWEEKATKLAQESINEEYLPLPESIQGQKITYHYPQQQSWKYLLFFGLMICISIPFLMQSRLNEQMKKREIELQIDYPKMVEQIVLLVGAGLTIKGAWIRIVSKYENGRKENHEKPRYVYEEMKATLHEMENGMSEYKAYEQFGKRIGLLNYMKFSTLLAQNLRKGSSDLLKILAFEATDAFRVRKEQAKILGEKAGTKLLLPMMLLLLIVFVMIFFAAFSGMQ